MNFSLAFSVFWFSIMSYSCTVPFLNFKNASPQFFVSGCTVFDFTIDDEKSLFKPFIAINSKDTVPQLNIETSSESYYNLNASNYNDLFVKNELYTSTSSTSKCWVQVSAGYFYTMAIAQNGTLWSWGLNSLGQLGLGDNIDRNIPTQVGTDTNWQSVSTKGGHTLAIQYDGTLWSWGRNFYGQLGLGDNTNRNTPTQIGMNSNWLSVKGGGNCSLALQSDGTLWSWGLNSLGQLGLGDNANRDVPTQVGSATNWQSIEEGPYKSTFAIQTNGTLWAWGRNGNGELGLGDILNRSLPAQVGLASNWESISAGIYFTLGKQTNGTLWAWGNNNNGELGLGDNVNRITPTQIGTNNNWLSVTDGYYFTLAIQTNGTLWSWGLNSLGQLGLGDNIDRNIPTQVGTDTNWESTYAGTHSFTFKTDGTLWTWGQNDFGQLGLGDNIYRSAPIELACPTSLSNVDFDITKAIHIYPNPTSNVIYIEYLDLTNSKLRVFDINGRKLINQSLNNNSNFINIEKLLTGVYFFRIDSNEGYVVKRVIIK
jgi:alpha-tubulin suppressor-like RCC1 family protein